MYLQISDLVRSDVRGMEAGAIRELELEFKLPFENESIASVSEIRWAKPVGPGVIWMGIRFLDIDMKDRGKILRYVVSKSIEDTLERD